MKAPVVMIGYSRKSTLAKSLRRLSLCEELDGRPLRLYLDAPYRPEDRTKCEEMYGTAKEAREAILPNLEIVRRERNYGVPGNLLSAVKENLDQFGRVVFFEDDVCVSRTFLTYMDGALSVYENDPRVFCINGYQIPYLRVPKTYPHDVYLNLRNMAWGFGTWKDRWDAVDFDMKDWADFKKDETNLEKLARAGSDLRGLIEAQLAGQVHTWDVQCTYHMVKRGLYAVEPRRSLTKNIGFGGEAVHCGGKNSSITHQRYYDYKPRIVPAVLPDERILNQFRYALCDPRLEHRIWRKLKRVLWGMQRCHDEPVNLL